MPEKFYYCDGSLTSFCVNVDSKSIVYPSSGHTHNYNEYLAILAALSLFYKNEIFGGSQLVIFSDSQLAINQLNTLMLAAHLPYHLPQGRYKIHADTLRPIAEECLSAIKQIQPCPKLLWLHRCENLAGITLDDLKRSRENAKIIPFKESRHD